MSTPPPTSPACRAAALLLALLLAACSAVPGQAPTPAATTAAPPPATLQPVPADPSPTPPQPTAAVTSTPEIQPLTHYSLTAVLDYNAHRLQVDEQIAYTNTAGEALDDLVLMVDSLYFPGTFTLTSLAWEDGAPVENVERQPGRLRLPLAVPLLPGEGVVLSITFELQLPSPQASAEVRPVPFGYTARQANLVDWYPFIAPYRGGQGWLAHNAGFFGEHLAYEVADFEVRLRLENPPAGLVIAASAPAVEQDGWLTYRHDAARNFVFSASPEYEVLSATAGSVTVMGYAFPVHRAAGQAALDATARSLELYSRLYGPYPRPLLSLVEADFLDGMEYDGLYFLSNGFYNLYQGTPGEYLVAIAVHETAHQWFYAAVGNDQALEPWLDEALCTYSERLFYENLHPEALPWWWDYRVRFYNPQGPVDGSIYNPAGYRPYRDAVYLNGAVFLEDLRTAMGDPAFFAFIKDYVARMRGKIATGQDFFDVLQAHTGVDLAPMKARYFSP